MRGGFYQVPEGPGLGVEIDERALKKYRVSEPRIDLVRHIYTHSRDCGESVCFATTNRSAFHGAYTTACLPICEQGSTLEITDDDGSAKFAKRYGELESEGISFREGEGKTASKSEVTPQCPGETHLRRTSEQSDQPEKGVPR